MIINCEKYDYEEGAVIEVLPDGRIACTKGKLILSKEGTHGVAASDEAVIVALANNVTVEAATAKAKVVVIGDNVTYKKYVSSDTEKKAGVSKGTGSNKSVIPAPYYSGIRKSC